MGKVAKLYEDMIHDGKPDPIWFESSDGTSIPSGMKLTLMVT